MKISADIIVRLRKAAIQYGVFVCVGFLATLAVMFISR